MAEEDFDVAGLAAYLHVGPAQVAKLADRGKLPGRKVGGEWRFSRPEIHHWLEDRIGLSDDAELAEMETVLTSNAPADAEPIRIADLLPREATAVPLAARTQGSVIRAMAELAAGTGLLWDAKKMAEAVQDREAMHSTALDIGVALLHPRRPRAGILGEQFLALGVTSQGIPFGGGRGGLTDVFFLICSMEDQWHLRVLARLSRLIGDSEFLARLRAAPDAQAAHALIAEYEAEID
jgi:PTS system nitrogen regulatory IIA component